MAYPVIDAITLTPTVVNATTYVVTMTDYGLTLVDDDYIVLYVHTHASTGSLSISGAGWSELVELDVTSGGQMAVYACKVAAGAVADPTITATVTTTWQVVLEQWRDVATGAAVSDGFEIPTPTQANASSVASPTFTPAAADGTIVYFGAARGGTGQHCRFLSDKIVAAANPQIDISYNSFAMAIGTVQQTSAAVTAQTMYAVESNRLGCITFAVKNKTGGKPARDCRAAMTKIGWFGSYGTAHESLGSLTFNAPSTFCVWNAGTEAMSGVNLSTTAASTSHTTQGLPPLNGRYSEFASAVNAEEWVGVWWATLTTLDMTGQIFTMEWFMPQLGDAIGSKGVVVAFGDSATADTGNAAVFQLAPKLQIPPNVLQTSHVAVETATQLAAVGSIVWSTIKKIGIFYHRAGSTTNRVFDWRNMFLHGSHVMTGGNATVPLNGQFLDNVLNGWGYTNLCTKSGDAMLAKTSFTFGDASKPTYVDTTATLINTPAKYSTNSQALWNVPANTVTVGVNAASGDTMRFVASAIAAGAGAEQNFTVTGASGATVSTQGGVFGNLLWTGTADFDPTGATYSGCDEVAWTGALVTNCSVTNTTSTDAAASVTANTTISDTTIDGTGALYALELGTSVTAITLTDCTITAGSTDKVHVLKTLSNVAAGAFVVGVHYRINTVGTTDFTAIGASANTIGVNFTAAGAGTGTGTADEAVKITISGSTSLSETDVTTAGAPAWISAPELNQSVVVSGFTAGSRIQIYDTTNSEELFNGTATAGDTVVSGTTATWTDPLAASGTRAIRVRVSYVNGATAKQFIETSGLTCGITEGTESVTYPISQVADETYDNNGIDGPAIYATSGITFTDAATDLVNISIAGGAVTWPTIYACFVYWIFTAAGIDDDVAYIDAPDTANYLLTSMKLKNTHANPLTVTSGFGRSATTGLVADIIDASGSTGNIYPTPDHVVAYATGSGALTAGDITNIWSAATRTITTTIPSDTDNAAAVLAAAQTTPIHADIRKVNNHTVDGVGSDADPWGPA